MIQDIVGNRVKYLRGHLGLSQEKLALKCDLDRTYLNSVENGKRNISIVNIEKICRGLEITLEDFFKGIL